MRELRTFGSVRDEGGDILIYSATYLRILFQNACSLSPITFAYYVLLYFHFMMYP